MRRNEHELVIHGVITGGHRSGVISRQVNGSTNRSTGDRALSNLAVALEDHCLACCDRAVRDEIELTLARLNQGAVFPAPRAPLQSEVDSALLPLMEVINHAESQGLRVHLNGDVRVLEGIDCDAFEALTAAVAQCLKNVVQHSGQHDVELVILRSQQNISFTIIDGGKGFLLEDVPQDRLGLKVSVFERMQNVGGSATVWSKPGNGAAIMLQIPTKGAT